MDVQSEQIIKDLEDKRERLSENFEELQHRMREVTNWRTYYNRNPWMGLGIAAAGGFLLSAVLGLSRRR